MKKWISLLLVCAATTLFAREQHPVTKVNAWFKEEKGKTPGSFHRLATLATVSSDGNPHTRLIELVGLNPKQGALFFTHKNSDKCKQIDYNSHAALNIWLPLTHRQISIEGTVAEIPPYEAEKSWKKMPRFMKMTFLSSESQGDLTSNETLEERKNEMEKLYPKEVPMPTTFVGYRFIPFKVIFYEIQPRSFPLKHVAHITPEEWTISQVEP